MKRCHDCNYDVIMTPVPVEAPSDDETSSEKRDIN